MVKRCGCASTECACVVYPGRGMGMVGDGNTLTPYEFSVGAGGTQIIGVGSAYMSVIVNGDGTAEDPYIISMTDTGVKPPDLASNTWAYETPGTYTWTRPSTAPANALYRVVAIGAGAGGGASRVPTIADFSPVTAPGGGGGGGGYSRQHIVLDAAYTGATIVVGSGGTSVDGSQIANNGEDTTITFTSPTLPPLVIKAEGGKSSTPTAVGQGGRGTITGQSGAQAIAQPTASRVNLFTWPSAEDSYVNSTSWYILESNVKPITRQSGFGYVGSYSFKQEASISSGQSWYRTYNFPVEPTVNYVVSSYTYCANTFAQVRLDLIYWDRYNNYITEQSGSLTASTGAWIRVSTTMAAPTNAAFVSVRFYVANINTINPVYWDAVMLERGTVPSTYFDGNTTDTGTMNYSWEGEVNASQSIETPIPTPATGPGLHGGFSGAGGGAGYSRGDSASPASPGGVIVSYEGASGATQMVGANGGNGGLFSGSPGNFPGGGGGGGGNNAAPTTGLGGRGGRGAAWITSL